MPVIAFLLCVVIFSVLIHAVSKKKKPLAQPAANIEKNILEQEVPFYQKLSVFEKVEFEKRIQVFLQKVRITGVETTVEDLDRVLIAASAIIPIFAFKEWIYSNIHEVLLYPSAFNHEFETKGNERNVLGMVGNGTMQNIMILSKESLRNDFSNSTNKSNAAIHEFVHLIDKDDGTVDGCPLNLLPHKYALPWLKCIHQEIKMIEERRSDINPYGTTNDAEFLAVASEYFFEQPQLMQRKHPELYRLLEKVFFPAPEAY